MSANAALFAVGALLCLQAARSLPLRETLDSDCLLFWQVSAYRPTAEFVVDENGHVVGKLFLKKQLANQGMAVWRNLLFIVAP